MSSLSVGERCVEIGTISGSHRMERREVRIMDE